jgi:hypothetical protein
VTFTAGSGDITDMGGISAQTTASLTAGGSFNQTGGTITAPISVTVLANNGAISQEANGTIKVSGLAGQVSLTAQSNIDLKGTVTAPDTAGASGVVNIRSNAGAITDNGVIRGNGVTLNAAGGISIAGLLSGAATVNLISGGSIDELGTLVADLLTGSAAGDASLTGTSASNKVTQLASFTSGQTLTLDDGVGLTITGPLTAPSIVIDTGANPLTLADKATITTGGIDRPPGIIPSTDFPPKKLTTNGAYFTTSSGFTQKGTSTILGFGGGPSVLRISAGGNANITFDPLAGLQGKNTWLILDIGTGKASGQINVKNLDVNQTGQAGAAGLTGSVTGLTGAAAAGVSGIQPSPNSNFRINSCPIASVNCVLLSTLAVPTANPLNDINIGTLSNQNDEYDLLLPIVSDQDY